MKMDLAMRLFGTAAIALALGCASFMGSAAQAVTLGFGAITANDASDAGIVEGSVTVNVTDPGGGHVSFLLAQAANGVITQPTVANLYFGDTNGLFDSVFAINSGTGVDWELGGNPANLPSQNTAVPPFTTTAALDTSANNPAPSNGVNPGEQVEVILALAVGKTFADVEAALADGSLRLGIHVINFASGSSESYVTPEPASLATLGLGLGLIALRRRKA